MTSVELVDIYLAHLGMRRISGKGFDPILPFFMLDTMYQIMTTEIKPVKGKFQMAQAYNRWKEAYNTFNQDFFACFDVDQQVEITDMMDAFKDYIQNDIVIAEVSVMNELQKYDIPFEHQKVLASSVMCHVLAQSAKVVWNEVYKNMPNSYIQAMIHNISVWMNLYFKKLSRACVDPNESKPICSAINILCRKMVRFLSTINKQD